jgi:hypothetical protein
MRQIIWQMPISGRNAVPSRSSPPRSNAQADAAKNPGSDSPKMEITAAPGLSLAAKASIEDRSARACQAQSYRLR